MARILIVDDDPSTRSVLASVLGRPDREIEVAADGEEALELIAFGLPDVLVTDVVMPRMNGFQLVATLRKMPDTASIPVIFLSSLADREDRVHGLRVGGDDYLAKPVDLDELCLRVEVALRRGGEAKRAEAPLHGKLGDIAVASLLSWLAADRRSGELLLTHEDRRARVALRDGDVIRARIAPSGEAGVRAIQELIGWSSGEVVFEPGPVTGDDEIRMNATNLLLEAARRLDET